MPHIKPTPIGRARPSCGNRIVTAGPGLTMRTFTLVTALCALVAATGAQQFGGGNYLDNDYVDFQEPSRPAPPPPQRSYSRPAPAPAAPVRSSQSFAPSSGPRPTPVPILKQINRHNEDGSYTYGYEGADGSFKIETKLTTGEVMGKYGYVDDLGKVRVVEYGANKFGFQPSGEGITVAPPTLVDETKRRPSADQPDYDDGQYYEQSAPAPPRPAGRSQRPLPAPQRAAPAPLPPRPVARPPPPPPQTYETVYEAPEPQYQYQPAPPPAPRRPAPSSLGPVPPRAQVPGAAPVGGASTGGVVYSQPRAPRPQLPPSPPPRPSPVFNSQPPPPPPPPRPHARSAGGGAGILDQLARDYALPQSGAVATSDVSFGYY